MSRRPFYMFVPEREVAGGRVKFTLKPVAELPITNVDPPTHGAHHEG